MMMSSINDDPKDAKSDVKSPRVKYSLATQRLTSDQQINVANILRVLLGTSEVKEAYPEFAKIMTPVYINGKESPGQRTNIDCSPTGTGKTTMTLAVIDQLRRFETLNYFLLILCPASLVPNWQNEMELVGFPNDPNIVQIFSYETFAGTSRGQLSHPWLERFNESHLTPTGKVKKNVEFRAPPEIVKFCKQRPMLIVTDEVQRLKNNNLANNAIRTILSVSREHGFSRYLALSASPFDKKEQIINYLRMIGVITEIQMYHTGQNGQSFKGLGEVLHFAQAVNSELYSTVMTSAPWDTLEMKRLNKGLVENLVFDLFVRVIKPTRSTGAPPLVIRIPNPNFGIRGQPAEIEIINDVKSGYYLINKDDQKYLDDALNELAIATEYDPKSNTVRFRGNNFSSLMAARVRIEKAKLPLFLRLTQQELMAKDAQRKVVLMMYFSDSINWLYQQIKALNLGDAVIYDGQTKKESSMKLLNYFNNDPRCRVIICQINKGAFGLSLHDTDGHYPRTTFISPSFDIQRMFQAANRTYRLGLKSQPIVRIVYAKVGQIEQPIFDGLARKSQIMREVISTEEDDEEEYDIRAKFPGEYPSFDETEGMVGKPQ